MKKFVSVLWVIVICSCSGEIMDFDKKRDCLAEGAARAKFYIINKDIYEKDHKLTFLFSEFKLKKTKKTMDGLVFWQYKWTYIGDLELGKWSVFSVYLAKSEDGIWVEAGSKF